MERALLAVAIVLVAGGVAALIRRRSPTPVLTTAVGTPDRVIRADLGDPDAQWVYVLFSSATCDTCPAAAEALAQIDDDDVATVEIEFPDRRDLHERYSIEAVPLTLLVDDEGVVRESFLGRTSPDELREALGRARSAPS